MGVGSIRVQELVQFAVNHTWSVPEFQRGFVWKPTQVRDLADSLLRGYPIGSLLLWNSPTPEAAEERAATDGQPPASWLVDGQQRASALAILFNRKPYWWEPIDASQNWNKVAQRYDIRFDVQRQDEPPFVVADAVARGAKTDQFVPVSFLLNLDTSREADRTQLEVLAHRIKQQGLCADQSEMKVYTMLDAVTKIRNLEVPTIATNLDLEDVVHIFELLNRRGTRVTEADVYLAIVAAKQDNRAWVRSEFLPFLKTLRDEGFDLDPNLLFRSLTAVGVGKVRFRDIDKTFWQGANIKPAWQRTTDAWTLLLRHLRPYGVLSDDPLPTMAALVTLIALVDKFPKEPSFNLAMYWFVEASRFGRYSGSATTASDQDLGEIKVSGSLSEAVQRLCRRLDEPSRPLTSEDFKRDYTDGRFGRFLLYLLAFDKRAQDWDETGFRIGFEGGQLARDYRPQWHHVFPVKYLEPVVEADDINRLANIAVIGPSINIRISAKAPMNYLEQYKISDEKLRQQLIEPEDGLRVTKGADEKKISDPQRFAAFVEHRADRLAAAANEYLARLGIGLDLPSASSAPGHGASIENIGQREDDSDAEAVDEPEDEGEAAEDSAVHALQFQFWNEFQKYCHDNGSLLKFRPPRSRGYQSARLGVSGFSIVLSAPSRGRRAGLFGCELYVRVRDAKRAFDALYSAKGEIEAAIGGQLNWERLPERHPCRIAQYRSADIEERTSWPELFAWGRERMERFAAVFGPRVVQMKDLN